VDFGQAALGAKPALTAVVSQKPNINDCAAHVTNKGITKPVDVTLPLRAILVRIDAISLK
jgi:hypothetical protein